MDKVFIVVLNWNRKKDTLECLNSLFQLNKDGCELSIVIVDNASKDDSVLKFRKLKETKKNIFLVENKENLGFTEGNNVGIRLALERGADFVMVLNNDTLVDKNLVVNLVYEAKKDESIGLLCPKIYFAPGFEFHKNRYKKMDVGRVIWYAGGIMDWNNVYAKHRGVDEVDEGQYDIVEETDFATGACCMFTRKTLEKVGLYEEKYYMYMEDVDISQRIKKKGFKIIYVPDAVVWHKVARSSGVGSGLNDYFITRNRLLFGIKYAPLKTKLALVRESWKLKKEGREWQRIGVKDFEKKNFGRGSWK